MAPTSPVKIRTSSNVEFPAHGQARVCFTGQVVRLYVEGPWNREFVVEVHDSLRAQIKQRGLKGPWAMLVRYEAMALCGPDSLKAIRDAASVEASTTGRIATAWVVPDGVEGGREMITFAQSTYAGINPIRVYRTEGEAEEWLAAMLELAQQGAAGQVSLFARAGGSAGIRGMVDSFYQRVLADAALAPFFKDVGMDKLRTMQFELFAAALGGPVEYSGRPLVQAHQHLGIGLADYQRFARHLFDTLDELHLTEQERYEIVGRLNLLSEEIVGTTGLVA